MRRAHPSYIRPVYDRAAAHVLPKRVPYSSDPYPAAAHRAYRCGLLHKKYAQINRLHPRSDKLLATSSRRGLASLESTASIDHLTMSAVLMWIILVLPRDILKPKSHHCRSMKQPSPPGWIFLRLTQSRALMYFLLRRADASADVDT